MAQVAARRLAARLSTFSAGSARSRRIPFLYKSAARAVIVSACSNAASNSLHSGMEGAGSAAHEGAASAAAPVEDDPTRGGDKFFMGLEASKEDALLFSCVRTNSRPSKPRRSGITEIRGPYYTPMGLYYLQDLLGGMGQAVDGFKFAGGSFRVMNRQAVAELIQECHLNDVYVSTGAWIEFVLTQGRGTVQEYLRECKEVGFDVVELSARFAPLSDSHLLRLVKDVHQAGLRVKLEVGVQRSTGGAAGRRSVEAQATCGATEAIRRAKVCLKAGVELILVESEGITDGAPNEWRADLVARFTEEIGPQNLMFRATDPEIFTWYVKNCGTDVNLLVDHGQIVQLETLRHGIWGPDGSPDWVQGRKLTYK